MSKSLCDFNLHNIYKKWHDGCGAFECYVHSTCFVSLKHYPDFLLPKITFDTDSTNEKICSVIRQYKAENILFLIDLPTEQALKSSYILNKTLAFKPILTLRHIHHPFGIVGDSETISGLLQYGEQLSNENCMGFVFVLDSSRYDDYEDDVFKQKFNNQYEITEYDLPPLEMLKDLQFEHLVILFQQSLKEDLEQYAAYLQENGMDVTKVVI